MNTPRNRNENGENMCEWNLQKIVLPLLDWYEKNARILPWRQNTDPYRVWVSEIMLQQTRVEAVIPYYNRFMEQLPTVEALADCSEETLMKLWEGLGYYSRARNLKKAACLIQTHYGGTFPQSFEQINALPGVGTYTAGAVSSIAFEQKRAAVDGNVLRVITRITACDSDIMNEPFRRYVTQELEKVYPDGRCGAFTQSLMELGATVCVPNKEPLCAQCPVRALCKAYATDSQMLFPNKTPKAKRKILKKTVFHITQNGLTAIRKRESGGLLGGMWEYPNAEGHLSEEKIQEWLQRHKIKAKTVLECDFKKHVFTHIEWHMNCYRVVCGGQDPSEDAPFLWVTEKQLETEYALPTAFKKLF